MDWLEKLRHARRVSVPLVGINTPDPAATVRAIAKKFGANGEAVPIVQWDACRGVMPVNDAGRSVAALTGEKEDDITINEPVMFLIRAADYPKETIVFLANPQLYWDLRPTMSQAIWNLRDQFKSDRRMLILLGTDIQPPAIIKDDLVVLDEPLPGDDELQVIVRECDEIRENGRMDEKARCKAVEAVRGLNAFATEQSV